jgi:hypothetical protein
LTPGAAGGSLFEPVRESQRANAHGSLRPTTPGGPSHSVPDSPCSLPPCEVLAATAAILGRVEGQRVSECGNQLMQAVFEVLHGRPGRIRFMRDQVRARCPGKPLSRNRLFVVFLHVVHGLFDVPLTRRVLKPVALPTLGHRLLFSGDRTCVRYPQRSTPAALARPVRTQDLGDQISGVFCFAHVHEKTRLLTSRNGEGGLVSSRSRELSWLTHRFASTIFAVSRTASI